MGRSVEIECSSSAATSATTSRAPQRFSPALADFAPLGGVFGTPAVGDLFSARHRRAQLNSNHTLVARHTLDTSSAFGPVMAGVLPSGWPNQTNDAEQTAINGRSLLPREMVNEIRLSYFHLDSLGAAAGSSRCPGCFGLEASRASASVGRRA